MHEMGIVSGILESVISVARTHGASRICQVNLRIGDIREVVPETLMFAWEVLREDDPLTQDCELAFEEVHPKSVCTACGLEFSHDRFHLRCPACGSAATKLLQGRELDIVSIEVEQPDEDDQPDATGAMPAAGESE